MADILIKNTKVLYNNYLQPGEVVIEDGKIARIGKDIRLNSVDKVIDANGALTLPAGIDVHVHFREPGMTHKEDWYTGSSAAAAGGITTVIEHPNTLPPVTNKKRFNAKLKLAEKKSIIDFGLNGGVSHDMSLLSELWDSGITSFGEIFMAESTAGLGIDMDTLENALIGINKLDAIPCIHAEDEEVRLKNQKYLIHDMTPMSHSRERSNMCEAIAIEKALDIVQKNHLQVHFCHTSTKEGLGLIRREKYVSQQAGFNNITCEVAPHHLFLSTRDWDRLGSFGKMNPPLRDRSSVKILLNSINDGTVDMIASDHAPHLEHEKDSDIKNAPSGVPGVETLMPLMLSAVKKNLLPLGTMVDVTSRNPAKRFGLVEHGKGIFGEGYDADLIILDSQLRKISADDLHSKAGWTPYEGMEGVFPRITIARGEIVFDEEVTGEKGRGNFLNGKGSSMDINS
ncbi:dihydroorotase [Methanosalsum natronophilum]|uniref:dihydroorotase n=1 Tax=Methanosalsum natronophilum TaxID=768733 RepID=UPI0021692EAD|nr:dihydroorotase [Methanosalsum natronophilum]MCS3924200.1 dihydroorotase [Methanosalsum natronophilum]